MNEEVLKKLYASASEYFDMPDFDQFKTDMQDEETALRFKKSMSEYYDMPNDPTFLLDIGIGNVKKKDGSTLEETKLDSQPKGVFLDTQDTEEPEELEAETDYLELLNKSMADMPIGMRIPGKIVSMFADADYQNAWNSGIAEGYTPEQLSATLFSDKVKTIEDAEKIVNAAKKLEKVGPSKAFMQFQKTASNYEKKGHNGFTSSILSLAQNPEVATEVILRSFISLGPAVATNPVDMMKSIGAGAVAGFMATGTPLGAKGGAAFGVRFGLNMVLDSALSSIEFLKEELGDKDFTPDNVLEVLNDKKKYDRIVSRSTTRGSTIGVVEGVLGKFAAGMSNKAGAATVEILSGGLGEAAAQVMADQEISAQDIILESVGGIVGLPGVLAESKAKQYTVNGERVTKEKAQAVVDNLTSEELGDVDIKSNDEEFINNAKSKKNETKPAEGNRLFSEPLQDATTVAERFAERTGRTIEAPERITEIDEENAKKIGKAYDEMVSDPSDPQVAEAYEAMISETMEQFQDIVDAGYQIEVNDTEPYRSSTEMIDDLRNNKNMKIFSTESGFGKDGITDQDRANNPLLRDSGVKDKNGKPLLMNDVFRFVHDFFGHAKLGNSFGPIGEENAWNVHSKMYSPLARRAMTSETRGQNSWVNFSGVNEEAFKLRDEAREIRKKAEQLPEDSPERKKMLTDAFEKVQQVYEKMRFADQKIGLLPDEMVGLTEEETASIKSKKKPSKERVESIIDGIIKKTEARLTPDVDPKKKLSNVLSYLQENSKLYEQLNDSQREKMVIDLTKKLGIPVESSPQIRTVLGIKKEAPVTIKVKPFEEFKKRLRELEKVSREAVKFTKKQQAERRRAIIDLVKELRKKGRLSSAQQQVILNRVTSAVIDEKNFDNVMSYVKKVYDNAELAEKLRSIVALQKRSFGKRKKKNIQTKLGVAPQLYPQVEKIATMDVRNLNLDKVDDMLDVLSVLGERKAVLDLAKLKDMSGKIESILSDENVAPEVTPQQAQAIEKDNEFMRQEFNSITEEEFDSLPEKLKRNIGRTRANVAAGFMSPDAIDVIKEVNATRSSKIVLEKINPNKLLDAIAFGAQARNLLRKFLNKSNNLYLSKIRSNSTRYIDDILGNIKGYEIYRNTFEPLSKAYGKLQGDLEVFSAKKQKAIRLIAGKNLTKKANEVTKSSVKMKLTALQFEFEFNENDKSTAKATDWLDATIEHLKEKDFSEHEVKFYEDIKKEFLSDENVSAEQLYSKLSDNEKEAYKIMQDANSDLVGKMLFTSAAVRGERPKTYNSYTYHDVLYSDSEYKGIVENKFQTLISQKPSTKAGTIIDRQPGVRAINLDIFSSSENGARQTLTDYHMTMPVRTLYSAIGKMKNAEGLAGKKKKAVSAISKAVDESLRNVFERDHVRSSAIEQATDFLAKVGYRAALGSLPRAASELLSNIEYVMIRNPKDFTKGMASLKQMTSVDGLKLFKSLGSVHTARLFGAQDQVSAFSGKTAFNRLDKNPSRVKSEIYNKAEFIVNAINNVSDYTSYINDTLIQSGDKAVSKPLWFGSFINKFQELTGVNPDFQKLSENDSDYFKRYSKEIKDSTFYADENINAAATSLNPFDSILKLQQKQGGNALSVAKRIYVMADAFMARFTIGEYMQDRRALHSLFFDGKMTTKQAAATLVATTARMSTYMLLLGLLRDQMRELFGIEPEEDDKMDLLKRQIVGSTLGLLSRGTSGNIPMVLINYGLERANEEYMESLRSYEDYDPYKHSIVFSQVTKDEIERGDYLKIGADVLFGPYTYPLNVGLKTAESYRRSEQSKKALTRKKYKDKLKYVHTIEVLGMLNVLPFYKDIRDIAVRKFMEEYPYKGKK